MSTKSPGLSYEAHKKLEGEQAVKEVAALLLAAAVAGLLLLHLLPVWGPVLVGLVVGAGVGWLLPSQPGWKVGTTLAAAGLGVVVLLATIAHDLSRMAAIGRRWSPAVLHVHAQVLGAHAGALVVWGLPWLFIGAGAAVLWHAYRARPTGDSSDDLGDGVLMIEGH